MFEENKFYIYTIGLPIGQLYKCTRVTNVYVSLLCINTGLLGIYNKKSDFTVLKNFVETSDLLKELF